MLSEEIIIFVGIIIVGLMFWVAYTISQVSTSVRNALSQLENQLIEIEDEARRLKTDAHVLRTKIDDKVDTTTLKRRLDGFASLLRTHVRR